MVTGMVLFHSLLDLTNQLSLFGEGQAAARRHLASPDFQNSFSLLFTQYRTNAKIPMTPKTLSQLIAFLGGGLFACRHFS